MGAIFIPTPKRIVKVRATGLGDMATITDVIPNPRFVHDIPTALTTFLAWTTGGTGDNTLTLYQKIYDEDSGVYDERREEFFNFGTDGAQKWINWRIQDSEEKHWTMAALDAWVPVWANPDAGNMRWSVELQFAIGQEEE